MVEKALAVGMTEKTKEFFDKGSGIYQENLPDGLSEIYYGDLPEDMKERR